MNTQAANHSQRLRQLSWSKILMPRLEDILFVAIFLAVIGIGPRLLNMDGDLGRHLTIGNYILDNFTIPTKDIFSHTMQGLALTPHEWLAQVTFALSYRLGGLNGVVILCALLLASTFTLVYRQSVAQSDMLLFSLVVTILAAAAASIHWLARPHLFTMLLTVLWLGELEKWRKTGRWRWWLLPLMMVVWVNLHGAFIVGVLIWLIYLLDHVLSPRIFSTDQNSASSNSKYHLEDKTRTRELGLMGISILILTLVNPVGWRIWKTTFGFLQNRYLVSHTVEYLPPDFQQISFLPFLTMICLSILLISFNGKRMSIAAALLLTTWTAFGLISARNIAIYAIIAAPLLSGVGASILQRSENLKRIVNFEQKLRVVDDSLFGFVWPLLSIFLIGGILLSGSILDTNRTGNKFSERVFPVKAVDWIIEQPNWGPAFNYFPWGGYLLYRTWPQQEVFIDGQTDFYGESLTREYEEVITLSEGWQEILAKYQIRWVIMPSVSDLALALEAHPKWEQKYKDDTAAVYLFLP